MTEQTILKESSFSSDSYSCKNNGGGGGEVGGR